MKLSRLFALGAVAFCALSLVSCARMSAFTKAAGGKMSELSRNSMAAIDRLKPKPRIAVVSVRHKDLKDMPLGHEKALAYQEKRGGWWFFQGPVEFKEPVLPDTATESSGSLLPPKDLLPAQ